MTVLTTFANLPGNLFAYLDGNWQPPAQQSQALRLRNHVEHLCVFVAAGESWQSGMHGCKKS